MPKAVFDLCVFDEVAFDESGGVPTAITQAASNIGETTARINGKISDDGGESCEARFRWRKRDETEILRPNAAGDKTSINSQQPDSGSHWDKVDEETPDDDTTCVYTDNSSYQRDLYNLPAHSGSGTINYIKIYFCCNALAEGLAAKPSLKSDSTVTDGTEIEPPTEDFITYSQQWNTNPADNQPWEWADIDALQIGVSLKGNGDVELACTQVYAEIEYWIDTEWQNTLETNDEYYEDLTGLDPDTEYEFQTQAKNSAGESAWSESAYFETALVITPSFIQAIASVVAPTVKQGNIIYVPTPIDAISKAVSPSVLYGAITPSPVSAIASGVNPIVVLTSISITPTSIEAIGQVVAPIVSTGGIIYVTPTPLDAIGGRVNPTVILGSISLTPSTLSAIAQVALGNVKQGNIIFSPAFIKALGKAVSPTVIQGSITLEPESIKAIARGENPEVILGSMTITAESVKALAGVIAPTVLETWVGRKLRIKIVTSQYRNLDIITSQKRNIDIVTAQKRKIKVLTSGS